MSEQKLIAATTMGNVVLMDPQFALPQRPHFPQGLVTVPLEDGLLVDGSSDQQVLRGRATKTLIPRLVPLLDGTHTMEQLQQKLPDLAGASIHNAVALLYTRGLLEDSAADPQDLDLAHVDPQILPLFERRVDVTRVNHSAREAMQQLIHVHVGVYALGPQSEASSALICKQLRQSGVLHVSHLPWGSDPEAYLGDATHKRLVVVLIEGEDDQALLSELDSSCARQGIPWLRVAVRADKRMADLGPYFEHGETACYSCFARANFPYQEQSTDEGELRRTHDPALDARLWANMLVIEVTYVLSRIALLATGLNVTRYHLDTWSTQRLRFPKLPGCVNCRPASVEMGMIETAVVYEDGVSFPSRHLVDPKAHQMHYRASNLELAHEGKRYPGAIQIKLPAADRFTRPAGTAIAYLPGGDAAVGNQKLDLLKLATLLMLGAGIRYNDGNKASKLQRWTPTGGNLGSVELFVAAHKVAGLASGYYFYQPHEHSLASLQEYEHADEVGTFIQQVLNRQTGPVPDALIILTAAHHRVSHKYGPFAYRIINLDAGVALSQLHLLARSQGLTARTAPQWADDLIADQLDLEDPNEVVTAVFALL